MLRHTEYLQAGMLALEQNVMSAFRAEAMQCEGNGRMSVKAGGRRRFGES